jgi:3-phenylpropionate/trans-cinnamate dioxygenase ferredoxin subunit
MAFMTLASLGELPEGGQLRVDLEDRTLLLVHLDGTIYAIDYHCTHDELGLEGGDLHNGCITCPYHGAEFRLSDGEVLAPPAWEPLKTYAVTVSEQLIQVDIPQ